MMTSLVGSARPQMGDSFGPVRIELNPDVVAAYTASTGDDAFDAHRGRMLLECGLNIAPPTILDRDVGTRLAATRYRIDFAMHAKQTLRWRRPLLCDRAYVIDGILSDIYERQGITYFTITGRVCEEYGEVALESIYTRAFEFPDGKHPSRTRALLSLPSFLSEYAVVGSEFPDLGGVLRGVSRRFGQELMNLYSGPDLNIHTDHWAASIRGLSGAVVQGLMALSLESALFRDVFGARWYYFGEMSTRFIQPIARDSILTPVSVVVSGEDKAMRLKSGVFDQFGTAVTISDIRVGAK